MRGQWDRSATGWDRWFDWYTRNLGPLFDWCCEVAQPDARVLDIGTGSGQPAISVAARVASGGSVVSIDIAPEMLRYAAARARRLGLDNIEFRVMDAENLEFDDAALDAVTFSCGLMFCPNPQRALSEMRRVLRSGGRYAIAVWDDMRRNPFLTLLGDAAAEVMQLRPPPRDTPHPFRFAPRGALQSELGAAGLSGFTVETRSMVVECDSPDQYWEIATDFAASLKPKFDALSAADRARLRDLVIDRATPFMAAGRLRLTLTALCATGRV